MQLKRDRLLQREHRQAVKGMGCPCGTVGQRRRLEESQKQRRAQTERQLLGGLVAPCAIHAPGLPLAQTEVCPRDRNRMTCGFVTHVVNHEFMVPVFGVCLECVLGLEADFFCWGEGFGAGLGAGLGPEGFKRAASPVAFSIRIAPPLSLLFFSGLGKRERVCVCRFRSIGLGLEHCSGLGKLAKPSYQTVLERVLRIRNQSSPVVRCQVFK